MLGHTVRGRLFLVSDTASFWDKFTPVLHYYNALKRDGYVRPTRIRLDTTTVGRLFFDEPPNGVALGVPRKMSSARLPIPPGANYWTYWRWPRSYPCIT